MKTKSSIVELGNTEYDQGVLYDLLIRLDRFYTPNISSRVDLAGYSRKLLEKGRVFCILNDADEYVGVLAMYVNDMVNKNAFISSIGILPEYHGTGWAADLMRKAIETATRNEMRAILLETDYRNKRAIGFYKKQGFRIEYRKADSLLMKKEINVTQAHPQPLVSISCITYNHAGYIRDALEGFLMQKTTFPIEILIHDDASTDKTAETVREYEKIHPDKIFPVYQTENQYSKIGDISQTFQFSRARGKYIALCEGDDYWTDPLKLQKQVDFLEAHPEYSGATHQSLVVFSDETDKRPALFRAHDITDIEIQHLLDGRMFHTASLMFRSEIIKKHSLPMGITSGDRALFFLIATFGKIHYSNEVMCCYRKHTGGISSWVTTEMLEKDLKIVPWILKINPEFPKHEYYKFLHLTALNYPNSLSMIKVIKHSLFYIYHSLFVRPLNFDDIRMFATHYLPLFLRKV